VSRRVIVEADGGSRGNPGPAGYGAVVKDAETGEVLAERNQAIGIETNNVAEYLGLIAGLTAAKELGATSVRVRMDSKLVVEQMSGRWQVKHPSMRPLAREASELAGGFAEISFEWIPRAQNSHADRLANEAMDAATGRPAKTVTPAAPRQLAMPTPQTAWLPPDSMPTRLILVRHGVTEHSIAKRFAGRSDLELTPDGVQQARQAAQRVAELGPVAAIVSSPLRRTRRTADEIAVVTGAEVAIEEDFAEADFGDWDGHTFSEVQQQWPEQLQAWLADPAVAPPNGESFDAVTRRVRRARDRVLAAHAGTTIAVVSHVSPIKILVRLAVEAPPVALHRMYLAPAAISVIDYFADGPVSLQSFNDSAHLRIS
jgi:probable phosphoglycerate mutase